MVKTDVTYRYDGEVGCKESCWKSFEIGWENFEAFVVKEKLVSSVSLVWYKLPSEEMKDVKYVFDTTNDDMVEIQTAGSECGEVDLFLEEKREKYAEHDDGYEADSGEECLDRPREDDEGEESEDEQPLAEEEERVQQEAGVQQEADKNDDGDEVVVDAGDGANDERFKSVFEEGAKSAATMKASQIRESEEIGDEAREAAESDEEDRTGDAKYPDTPVESEEEWDQWMSKGKTRSKPTYHGRLDEEPYIWLFQKFDSGMEFKDQLLRYALNTQYDVKMAKSEANRIAAVCCVKKCPWRVFCSVEIPINKWMVKVCHNKHNHEKSSRVSMLKQGVIAALFREELRRNVNMQASEIKDIIKERYSIVVPISKCYRGRRIALDSILEAQAIQFGKLWDYEAELRRTHPGIITELNTTDVNGVPQFDSFYICFQEFRETWKRCCRPVIGLDGCFLKWELNGDLLSAVGRDADNRMYPIAWAVVKGENKDTWGWFIKRLKADLGLGLGDNYTIISDKQKGLVIAVGAELPHAEHRMCARHIYGNWKKSFSRSEYKNLFWGVAYSYNVGEYDDKMLEVETYDPAAHAALLRTDPERWCRAYFSTESRCHDVHNNLSESFNRTIKIARSKPVLSLLEDIRRQAMRRIARRFIKAERCDTILTPITMALLEKARVENKFCTTIRSSSTLYEVNEFNQGYRVRLSTHECACRRWDLTGKLFLCCCLLPFCLFVLVLLF